MEARELEPDHYSVWHTWAVTNYDQLKKIDAEQADEWKDVDSLPVSHLASPIPTTSKSLLTTAPKTDIKDMKRKLTAPDGTLQDRMSRRGFGLGLLGTFNDRRGSMKRLYNSTSSFGNSIRAEQQMEDHLTPYIIEAIKGFVKSIVLGQGQKVASMLQDTLRLITLWFNYGTREGVHQELEKELDKISPDTWMAVVPQLIARMHVNSPIIVNLLRRILLKLASVHPQALVCPISVALITDNKRQQVMAADVVNEMRKRRSQLVEEATMVSRELMRVAITPHELWYDGLEKAASQYMENKDIDRMLETLTKVG